MRDIVLRKCTYLLRYKMGGGGGWGGEDAIVAIVAWTSSSALFTERRGEASLPLPSPLPARYSDLFSDDSLLLHIRSRAFKHICIYIEREMLRC